MHLQGRPKIKSQKSCLSLAFAMETQNIFDSFL